MLTSLTNWFGLDVVVAAVTAGWFLVVGFGKMRSLGGGGRRSVRVAFWVPIARRIRGVLQVLLGLGVLTLIALGLIGSDLPLGPIGLGLGLGLAVLATWDVVGSLFRPRHAATIVFSILGFTLAVFYAGFRS